MLRDDLRLSRPAKRDLPIACNEDFPVLTIRALQENKLLQPGALAAHSMQWVYHADLIVECHLEIEGSAFLLVRSRYGGVGDIIHLVPPKAGGRWMMICPFAQTRHDLLYYREGLFAGAIANRLVHGSQRKAEYYPGIY